MASRHCTQAIRKDDALAACEDPGEFYVMGPAAGDWAYYVCADHLDGAKAAGFTLIEKVTA